MKIYRTKNIVIDNKHYTIHFKVNNDESSYTMTVLNNSNLNHIDYVFTKETAQDFNNATGDVLDVMIIDIIKQDINNGII